MLVILVFYKDIFLYTLFSIYIIFFIYLKLNYIIFLYTIIMIYKYGSFNKMYKMS